MCSACSVLSYDDLEARWKALRRRGDVAVREVACPGAARTLLCAEIGAHDAPAISISAGVHGDEPAGPAALLQLVEERLLDAGFSYRLWPCTNPSGYRAGTRVNAEGVDINRTFGRGGESPEARAIVMANRDRKFALALDLHEDDEARGFYCYSYHADGIARSVIDALRAQRIDIDEGCGGLLSPDPGEEQAAIGGLSYSLLLQRNAARNVLTFETPSRSPFEERTGAHCRAVTAAIAALSQTSG